MCNVLITLSRLYTQIYTHTHTYSNGALLVLAEAQVGVGALAIEKRAASETAEGTLTT